MSMQESFNMFRKTWIDIDLDALETNLKHFHNDNKELIFVVKANGYGHGDLKVSKFAYQHCNIQWIAVSSLDEAYHIHKHVPELNILVLGYTDYQYIPIAIENKITLIIPSLEYAKNLPDDCENLHVHIKVDTGMNRLGCKSKEELQEIIAILLSKNIHIDGIFSHYACSDQKDGKMSKVQYEQFKEMVLSSNYPFKMIHMANTDGSYINEDFCNAKRVGLGAYGFSAFEQIRPCLSLKTQIIAVKEIDKDETVSYGAVYHANQKEWIATIPIGYADGWLRRNEGRTVYVNNAPATLIGRICMDQCMIRLQEYVPVGTEVELIGPNMPITTIANELQTIPYEIITTLSDRIPRIYHYKNEIIGHCLTRFPSVD